MHMFTHHRQRMLSSAQCVEYSDTLKTVNCCQMKQSCCVVTLLISGHLCLQVLRGHVELGLLVHRGLRFTFPTAAVTAATQAATEVAAGGQTADYKQSLQATHPRVNATNMQEKTKTESTNNRSKVGEVLPLPTSLKGQSKCWHSLLQTARPHTVPESHTCHICYASWGHSGWRGRCWSP